MAKNWHPVGETYALAVTATAQSISMTLPAAEPDWEILDYLIEVIGTDPVFISTVVPAVFPTTGQHKAGVMYPAGAIMIVQYPGTVTLSCISTGTGSSVYVTQGRGE